MATRQYIGARYVPMFFNGTGGSAEWVANTQYEALTIVTRNGNSYTSRKPVPANIGAPENNADYWVSTGVFNEQVEQYRQEVSNIANEIDSVEEQLSEALSSINDVRKRKFILIGDSFGYGIDGDNNTQLVSGGGWLQRAVSYLSVSGIQAYYPTRHMTGNAGFTSSLPFVSMLQACVEDDVPAPNEITDIVVLGGTNDIGAGSSISTAISSFVTSAKTLCPNAIIHIGCLGINITSIRENVLPYYKDCLKYGCCFINDTTNLFGAYLYVGTDGVHLTQTGYEYFAPYITNAILSGNVNYKFTFIANGTAMSGFSGSGNFNLNISVTPHGYEIQIVGTGNQSIYWDAGTAPSATGGDASIINFNTVPNLPLDYVIILSGDILVFNSTDKICYPYLHARLCFVGHYLYIYWTSGDFVMTSENRFKMEIPYEPIFISTN